MLELIQLYRIKITETKKRLIYKIIEKNDYFNIKIKKCSQNQVR